MLLGIFTLIKLIFTLGGVTGAEQDLVIFDGD
jgi:hypothetical protein